jgi:flagellar motility protein MotE (MotC chaperone)
VSLDARERRIAERETLLEVAEARVKSEISRLVDAEKRLADTLALADGAAERDVAHLVGVYETMKPKAAAVIFGEMEPSFAAGFMSRMRADAAASILAAMDSGAAYAVTAVMAGRHVGGVSPVSSR